MLPHDVSIHARHYWRARPPPAAAGHRFRAVSIHARHYWRARLELEHKGRIAIAFQSTPAITGGRDTAHGVFGLDAAQFQSTPAITGGRDQDSKAANRWHTVSIHARHYWRARPGVLVQ